MKLWSIYRNGQFVGTLRARSAAQAVTDYAEWAKCPASELRAE